MADDPLLQPFRLKRLVDGVVDRRGLVVRKHVLAHLRGPELGVA
jgi:hypothetical protein